MEKKGIQPRDHLRENRQAVKDLQVHDFTVEDTRILLVGVVLAVQQRRSTVC
jgi:hypothetical protein